MKKMKINKSKVQLNLEGLRIINKEGKDYLVLSELHAVFGVEPSFIANASVRVEPGFVDKYIRKFFIENSKNARIRKCLDIEGLPKFLNKLSYKFDNTVLVEFSNYVDYLISQENSKPHKARIVEFRPQEDIVNIDEKSIVGNMESVNDLESDAKKLEVSLASSEDTIEDVTQISETNLTDISDMADIDSVLNVMDGVLSMLSERSALKQENEALKLKIQDLEKEISDLKSELNNSKTKSDSIVKKATLIRDYVLSNK